MNLKKSWEWISDITKKLTKKINPKTIKNWIKAIVVVVILLVSYMISKELFAIAFMSLVTYAVIVIDLYWMSRQGLPRNRRLVTECPFKYGMVTRRGSRPKSVITGGRVKYDENFLLVNSDGGHIQLDNKGNVLDVDSFIKNPTANQSGISWIGIPFVDRIDVFHFKWNELVEKSVDGVITTQHIEQKEILTEFFAVLKTFGFVADSLEIGLDRTKPPKDDLNTLDKLRLISSQVTVDMTFALTVLIVDVLKAICTLNWYKGLQGMIRQKCLEYCGAHNIDEIIEDSGKELTKFIISLNEEILEKFGVVIRKASYNGYEFSGKNKDENEETATMAWRAEQARLAKQQETEGESFKIRELANAKAEEISVLAKANAERITLEGNATADAEGKLFKKLGDKSFDYAIAKAGVQTLVLNRDVGLNLPIGSTGKQKGTTP